MRGELDTQLEIGPIKFEEDKEGLKIEGVAIREGQFTGQDGHTINWNKDIFPEIATTLENGDIELTHEGHKGGAVIDTEVDDDAVYFKGLVWDDFGKKLLKEGKGVSIDANVTAEKNGENVWEPVSVNSPKLAIVDRPASEGARVQKIIPVQLERDDSQAGTEENSKEVSSIMTEQEQLWPKVYSGLVDEGYEEEDAKDIIEVLKEYVSSKYPDTQGEDGEAKEEKVELGDIVRALNARDELPDVFDTLMEEGFEPEEAKSVIELFQERLDDSDDDENPEKNPQLEELKEERDEWKAKYEELREEIESAKLESLVSEIEEIDAEFEKEEFLEGIEDFDTQKAVLERYKDRIESFAEEDGEVQLSVKNEKGSEDERVKKIAKEVFSDVPEVLQEE